MRDEKQIIIATVFTTYQWGLAVESASKNVSLAYNKAKLLFEEDEEFIDYIKKCWISFLDINDAVNRYVHSAIATQTVDAAWNVFQQKYVIQPGNYFVLF